MKFKEQGIKKYQPERSIRKPKFDLLKRMEAISYISVTITGKTSEGDLNPKDIDISETKELLTDVETLLFPNKSEREDRPKVSYEVKEGSVRNVFFIPAARVIMFTALMSEVNKRGNVDLLEPKAAVVIDKWQRKSYSTGRQYAITSSISPDNVFVKINKESQFIAPQSDWVSTSIYLYGRIFEEGGLSKVNLHILTDRYGKLVVDATEEQLTNGTNKLFQVYGLWVKGKQNVQTGFLKDLILIDFLTYQAEYDEMVLNKLIDKASENWKKIKDKDVWLSDIRGGENE
jgi:hypothetical protein